MVTDVHAVQMRGGPTIDKELENQIITCLIEGQSAIACSVKHIRRQIAVKFQVNNFLLGPGLVAGLAVRESAPPVGNDMSGGRIIISVQDSKARS